MNSKSTIEHSTIDEKTTAKRSRLGRIALAGGVVAGLAAASVGFTAAREPSSPPNDNGRRDLVAIAKWADENGLVGLSPASLGPAEVVERPDLVAIAKWADENGLVGLSPASLRPIEDSGDRTAP
jgi:hypothetical protein